MKYILFLSQEQECSFDHAGAKFTRLQRVIKYHFPVPKGFAVTVAAWDEFVKENYGSAQNYYQYIMGDSNDFDERAANRIESSIMYGNFPSAAVAEIKDAYTSLSLCHTVVRSSAPYEDAISCSYAGMLYTGLHITGLDRILIEIRKCWISAVMMGFSTYGNGQAKLMKTAVFVQEMIPAQVAGTVFTFNPVRQENTLVLNSNYGLGKTVVDGEVIPDEYKLSKSDLKVIEKHIACKDIKLDYDEDNCISLVPVADSQKNVSSLSSEQIETIGKKAIRLEKIFGYPLDIEWAIADDIVYILQVRPISERKIKVDWNSNHKTAKWTRVWRLGEWLSNPVSPLFDSLLIPILVYARENGGTKALNWNLPKCWKIKKPYYMIKNGYYYTRSEINPFSFLKFFITSMPRIENAMEQWKERDLPRYLNHIGNIEETDLLKMQDQELLSYTRELCLEAGEWWYLMALDGGGAGFLSNMLKRLIDSTISEDLDYNVLLQGFETEMVKGNRKLYEIAQSIHKNDEILSCLKTVTKKGVKRWKRKFMDIEGGKQFVIEYMNYLKKYGKQVLDLDFIAPVLLEQPQLGLTIIYKYATGELENPDDVLERQKKRRESLTNTLLSKMDEKTPKGKMLQGMLERVQELSRRREDTVFYFQMIFPYIRFAVLEIGKRLYEREYINSKEDVFFCNWNEICNMLHPVTELENKIEWLNRDRAALLESRKKAYQFYQTLCPPEQILPQRENVTRISASQKKRYIKGIGICGGKTSGTVKIVRKTEDLWSVKKDDIIVAVNFMPAWAPFLSLSSGVITEAGGITTHSSIIMREYGIPAIIGTGIATQVLQDGQEIEVDGTKGIAKIIRSKQ